ncbi:sensor histidine kinase [Adlercreutzia faecimuris]|uniref:histidine kinase n=1 Tax=Adlercreutzia faecimuris TaxID=2897341 RepID=A0ABS9WHX9_9ACTN|nr:HAMP domain-containing sensor histidine kinase [Adlercreutzia sp. JBNU-10]MCI2242409.1 HAMP domain-containing histidine kinase [Adlercreutzia sp. JBNU-10]
MALRSEQARVLRRSLLGRLGRDLAAFTAAFALACVLLEAFVMPPLADFVADSTSRWRLLDSSARFDELMADEGLSGSLYLDDLTQMMVDEGLPATPGSAPKALSWAEKVGLDVFEPDYLVDDGTEDGTEDGETAAQGAGANASASGAVAVDGAAADPMLDAYQTALDALVASGAVKRADDASAAQVAAMAVLLRSVQVGGLVLFTPAAINDADVDGILRAASWRGLSQQELDAIVARAFRQSQDDAYEEWKGLTPEDQALRLGVAAADPVWQASFSPDGYWQIREVGTYAFVKSLKLPLAAAVLVTGWIVIVVMALNRSLRYFDDLSEGVARLLADRDAPIELPPGLSIAQNELAVIRSQSLADERAAKAAERRKNELVAYLAHDIRTPLTSVLGYLDLLRDGAALPPDTQRKYAETAYAKAERLEGLIGEFFEITRYNLQAIPIERENVDVRLFCQQVAESFFPETAARGIGLRVGAPADVRFFVDPDKLARALGNVMRNAVAYAEDGTSIDLAAACDGPWVSIAVRNRGREISEAHLEAIFEKFYREDGSRTSGSGGAGLGLAIAKEIVGAHGGDITAASRDGVTVFTLRVPREVSFARSLADGAPGAPGAGAAPGRVRSGGEDAGGRRKRAAADAGAVAPTWEEAPAPAPGARGRARHGAAGAHRGNDTPGMTPLTANPPDRPRRGRARKR